MDKSTLESKVTNILQKLPKEEAMNYQKWRIYKRTGHMVITILGGCLGYALGTSYGLFSNYDKLIEFEQKYYPLTERLQEGFKFIASIQPEALLGAGIAGLIAYQITKIIPINYDKELIKKFSKSKQ